MTLNDIRLTLEGLGFVPDGSTPEATVRVPTVKAPVYGKSGGKLTTFPGRERWSHTGHPALRCTVGPRTVNLYYVDHEDTRTCVFLANLRTRDADVCMVLHAKALEWMRVREGGAPRA